MALHLADFEKRARRAVRQFWATREEARLKQIAGGKADAGERSGVTAGKNMDGFIALVAEVVKANGLPDATIQQKRALLTLPGYFRPTKLWDLLVINEGRLIAAVELKSQVGSFGNNFNNRTEEAIGSAHDLWTAYREGAFGKHPKPFVGWMILVEDSAASRSPVRDAPRTFPSSPNSRAPPTRSATTSFASASSRSNSTPPPPSSPPPAPPPKPVNTRNSPPSPASRPLSPP